MATKRQPPPPPQQQQQRHNSAAAAAGAAGGSVKSTTESSPRSHQPKPATHGDGGSPETSAPDVRPLEYTAESGKAEAVGNDATLDSTAPPATEMGQARRSHEDKDGGVSGAGLPVRRGVSSAASVSFGASAGAGTGDVIAEVAGGNGGDERDRAKVGDDVVTGVSTSSKASTGGRGDSASGGGGSNGSKERYSQSEKRSGERSFSAVDDAATATLPGGAAAADSRDVCLSVPGSSSPVCLKKGTGRDHEPPDPAITGGDGAAVPALRSTGDRGDDVPGEGVAAVGSNTNREEDMDLRPPIVVGGGSSPSAGQLSNANKLPPKASAPGGTGGTERDPPAVASSVTLNADSSVGVEEAGGAAEQLQPFSDSLQVTRP